MICIITDCDRDAKKRSLCPKHYHQQWKRANDAKPQPEPPAPIKPITGDALAWTKDAACTSTDPEMFFPFRESAEAKQFCLTRCLVLDQCLNFAMQAERGAGKNRHGIYGGKTPQERYRMERNEQLKAA